MMIYRKYLLFRISQFYLKNKSHLTIMKEQMYGLEGVRLYLFILLINLIFILNCLLQLVAICTEKVLMRKVTKALIIPLMISSYFLDAVFLLGYDFRTVFFVGLPVYIGLIFGWLGDIFLLSETGFVKGLLCFLLGHIAYIIHFAKNNGIAEWPVCLLFLIPYAVYFFIILKKLLPFVEGGMKVPVLCYMVVIITMGALSACLNWRVMGISLQGISISLPLNIFAVSGSALFIISDTILAFSTFMKKDNKFLLALVMITYMPAQLFIMLTARVGM